MKLYKHTDSCEMILPYLKEDFQNIKVMGIENWEIMKKGKKKDEII